LGTANQDKVSMIPVYLILAYSADGTVCRLWARKEFFDIELLDYMADFHPETWSFGDGPQYDLFQFPKDFDFEKAGIRLREDYLNQRYKELQNEYG
jgi:hypothetical protein